MKNRVWTVNEDPAAKAFGNKQILWYCCQKQHGDEEDEGEDGAQDEENLWYRCSFENIWDDLGIAAEAETGQFCDTVVKNEEDEGGDEVGDEENLWYCCQF